LRTAPEILLALSCMVPGIASAQAYRIFTVAGGGPPVGPQPALETNVGSPLGVAVDSLGNIYFSSTLELVFKLTPNGTLTRFAGNGTVGYSGDGGPATSAQLNLPEGLAVDSSGNVYIADNINGLIRKVSANGVISTVAGGCCLVSQTVLSSPLAITVDASGALYIGQNGPILKISPEGAVTTLANVASHPAGLVVDSSGNLYVGDVVQVLKVSPSGTVTTFAGTGQYGDSGDGGPALNATFGFLSGLAFDPAGDLIVFDGSMRKITPDGIVSTIADASCCSPPDGSTLNGLGGALGVDSAGDAYVALPLSGVVREVTPSGSVSTIAGNPNADSVGDGGPAIDAQLSTPEAVAVDAHGDLCIADYGNSRVRKVSASGMITTFAGTGTSGFSGDGGPATSAQLGGPVGLAVDSAGNVYISEYLNNRVRKVDGDGTITTVVGNGGCCDTGDEGPAVDAVLAGPHGITVDSAGNLFIADSLYSRIRKVTPEGTITTIAGTGVRGFSGDGGPATEAELNYPWDVAVDAVDEVFVTDYQNLRVRKISADGIITTVVAPSATFAINPMGLAVDGYGNVLFSGGWVWRLSQNGTVAPISISRLGESAPVSAIGGNGLAVNSQGSILVVNGNVIQELERPLLGRAVRWGSGEKIPGALR
jgi:trimeric autotransporter adhesin